MSDEIDKYRAKMNKKHYPIYWKIKDNEIADENFKLNPLTNYSKANSLAERNILKLSSNNFCVTVLRQGTVYGYSPKMRFDLVVNRMSHRGNNFFTA